MTEFDLVYPTLKKTVKK